MLYSCVFCLKFLVLKTAPHFKEKYSHHYYRDIFLSEETIKIGKKYVEIYNFDKSTLSK